MERCEKEIKKRNYFRHMSAEKWLHLAIDCKDRVTEGLEYTKAQCLERSLNFDNSKSTSRSLTNTIGVKHSLTNTIGVKKKKSSRLL